MATISSIVKDDNLLIITDSDGVVVRRSIVYADAIVSEPIEGSSEVGNCYITAGALVVNYDGGTLTLSAGAGSGDVVGPASSTDNAITRFSGATGKVIQNSGVTIDDNGNILLKLTELQFEGVDAPPTNSRHAFVWHDATFVKLVRATGDANAGLFDTGLMLGELRLVDTSSGDPSIDADEQDSKNLKLRGMGIGGTLTEAAGIYGGVTGVSNPTFGLTYGKLLGALNANGQAISNSGNITMNGAATVDGRDVSVDGTKLDGIAAGANLYVHPNHSGEVTSVADGAQTIANDAVTYAKMQDVSATDKVLGRVTAGAGDVEEIACTAFARSILDDADEATFKGTVNLEIGVDVLAQQTIGIADNNLLEVDDATAVDDDFARFTANGIEGLTPAEAMTALPAANTTTPGKVELAIASEINTGTDATRAVTPDSLAGSNFGIRYFEVTCYDYTTDCVVADGVGYFHVPAGLNGMNLVEVHAFCITAGTTGTMDIQIHNLTDTADMLSTKITIDTTETGSDTAATPPVINGATDDVVTNDVIRIDVDVIHTTAAKGLIVTLGFSLP